MEGYTVNIANDIRTFLDITGWSVQDLADAVGVTSQTLFKYLQRKESPSCADKLIPILYGPKRLDTDRLKSINKTVLKQKRVELLQQLVAVN